MNVLQTWVESPGVVALGWTLLHSLWEGTMVALLLACALGVYRSARARYAAGCLAMLALVAAFGCTFALMLPEQVRTMAFVQRQSLHPLRDAGNLTWSLSRRMELQDSLPWLAACWITGVVFFQLRGVAAWVSARRLRRTGVCPAPHAWRTRLEALAERLGVSGPVAMLESGLAGVPMVTGYLRPVILMPVGMMSGLSAGQIESILLHELAHIRRHDYLVNLAQSVVEGLLFYHPAVWWISKSIRAERENCCDDIAVAISGDAYEYALALAALEESRTEMVLAASGGSLLARVRRLLGQPQSPRLSLTPVISALALVVALSVGLSAWQQPQRAQNPYEKWVKEDVVYIISDRERAAFKSLSADGEREQFIRQFWERRNPTQGSVSNPMKEEHYRRIAYTNSHFGTAAVAGWKSDRGRIYITYGPPDELESHPSPTGAARYEEWMYRWIEGVGRNVIIRFVDESGTGFYRMTRDPHGAP